MTAFQLVAVVLALTCAIAYLNARVLKLPSSVGLMATALVGSIALLVIDATGAVALAPRVRELVTQLDFGNTLLHGMLGLLLFAGALHIDVAALGSERVAVGLLALGGTIASAALVGGATYAVLAALGHDVRWIEALLFGALIAPTDPIAVLGMLKSAGAPRRLEVRIAGESLFNDGVGVVIFTVLLGVDAGVGTGWSDAVMQFAREALGGAAFGGLTGYVALRLVRSIDDYSVEVLITLTLVVAGYAAAEQIQVSAPIGAVVAGLVIGNHRHAAMSDVTRVHVDMFWKLIDEILNAVLFLMIGLAIMLVPVSWVVAEAAALAIPIVLGARWLAVGGVMLMLPAIRRASPHSVAILTWGGLRGGLSIAMALALPAMPGRDLVLVLTYSVVAFSILVQGLSFGPLLRALKVGDGAP
jgi:monovalent cation:H+ antiporter, CPA1 family